jgi:hypothetical protein
MALGLFAVRSNVHVMPGSEQYSSEGYARQWSTSAGEQSATAPAPFSPVWIKMLLLAVILAVPIALGLKAFSRGHWHIHAAHFPSIGLALLAIPLAGIFLYMLLGRPREMPATATPERRVSSYDAVHAMEQQKRTTADEVAKAKGDSPSRDSEETKPQTAEAVTPETTAPPEDLPEWVNDSPQRKDGVYYEVVRIGGISDPNMRYEMLNAKLQEVANRYIEDIIFGRSGATVNVPPDYLREHCNGGEFTSRSSSGAAFFRLKFDKDFRTYVEQQYRGFVAEDHLWQLGGIVATGFALLGGLYMFLRMTPQAAAKAASGSVPTSGATTPNSSDAREPQVE